MGSNPTPSAKIIDIIDVFGNFRSCAQSDVQTRFEPSWYNDIDTIGALALLIAVFVVFVAAKLHPR